MKKVNSCTRSSSTINSISIMIYSTFQALSSQKIYSHTIYKVFIWFIGDDSYNLDPILSEYYDSRAFTPPVLGKDTLKFDSNFESGNLFCAFQVGNYEYDLMMQQDINSHGSTQWFFFSV